MEWTAAQRRQGAATVDAYQQLLQPAEAPRPSKHVLEEGERRGGGLHPGDLAEQA
jgi:hypothetical protein